MSSFLGRLVIIGALAAGVYSVFRRDILRIGKFLKKPTENFIADIKKELDTNAVKSVSGEASSTPTVGESLSSKTPNLSTPSSAPERQDFQSSSSKSINKDQESSKSDVKQELK